MDGKGKHIKEYALFVLTGPDFVHSAVNFIRKILGVKEITNNEFVLPASN